jgi:hypothetical protein
VLVKWKNKKMSEIKLGSDFCDFKNYIYDLLLNVQFFIPAKVMVNIIVSQTSSARLKLWIVFFL